MAEQTRKRKVGKKRPIGGKRAVAKRPRGKKTFVIDQGLRKMIREEAAKLKMSEEDYLRLVVHFSEVMRTSILPAGLLDGGLLQMILANPMALGMLKNVIGNMMSRFGGNKTNTAPGNAAPGVMMPGTRSPMGNMGMGNPMAQRMPGPQGMPVPQGMPGMPGGSMNPMMSPQARAGQMGNPMGNMMYGMNGQDMNGQGMGMGSPFGSRPMQGMPGMGMNPGGGQAPQSQGGGGLSNLFSMDNLTQMFTQFFGNQAT